MRVVVLLSLFVVIYYHLTQHDFLPLHPSLRKYTGRGMWRTKQKFPAQNAVKFLAFLKEGLSQVAAEVKAGFEGFRGNGQPPHLCTHLQTSEFESIQGQGGEIQHGVWRRAVGWSWEVCGMCGWILAFFFSFSFFYLTPTTITACVYTSPNWVIWTVLFAYRISNSAF